MLFLAADTSGKYGSIALARCDQDSVEPMEIVAPQGGTFSAQLVPQIAVLLSRHNLSKHEIDALAVISGPGSFTGLRVGLAAIKALAEVLQKPIVAASLLEVIAFELLLPRFSKPGGAPLLADFARSGNSVLVALDASRNEAYVGEYRLAHNLPVRILESLLPLEELMQRAREGKQPIYTPDQNLMSGATSLDPGAINFVPVPRPDAASLGRIGYRKLVAGQTIAPIELDANYIRRADAEIKQPQRNPSTVHSAIPVSGGSTILASNSAIRHAQASDIPSIVELERSARDAAHWSETAYMEMFDSESAARIALVIAEGERRISSFLIARFAGSECELENIVVSESCRRNGFGSRLIQSLVSAARERHVLRLFLEVRESNAAARALYESCGFHVSGHRTSYYSAPAEDAITYVLSV